MTSIGCSGRNSWNAKVRPYISIRHLAAPLVGLALSSCASNPLAAGFDAPSGILKRSTPNPHPTIFSVGPQEHVKVVNSYLKRGDLLIGFSDSRSQQEISLEQVGHFATSKDADIAVYTKELSVGGDKHLSAPVKEVRSGSKVWRYRLALLRLGARPAVAPAAPKPLAVVPSAPKRTPVVPSTPKRTPVVPSAPAPPPASTYETQKTSEETLELKPKISGDY